MLTFMLCVFFCLRNKTSFIFSTRHVVKSVKFSTGMLIYFFICHLLYLADLNVEFREVVEFRSEEVHAQCLELP